MNSRDATNRASGFSLALLGLLAGFVSPASVWAAGYLGYDKVIPSVGGGENNAQNIDIVENLGDSVPRSLAFVDGHGVTTTVGEMLDRGKPVIVTLGYFRCPLLCNLVHEGLAKALKKSGLKLGEDFTALAVSVDPQEDRKSANTNQRRLLRSLGAEDSKAWPFVFSPEGATLDASPARTLSDALGFRYFYDAESKQFAHAAAAFVLTPSGKISRYLYGVDFDDRDLRLAVVEASGGRVGTTLDRVLLTCFRYDPMTRKYTPFVAGFVRIGAGLSGLALFTLLAILWRKELLMRRQRRLA